MVSLDLWHFPGLDPYRIFYPLLLRLDPEKAHTLAIKLLEKGWGPKDKSDDDSILHTTVCGIEFRNPLGLAAGFDKNAEVFSEALDFGFGFAEIGTVTPLPQPGNPKPRLFRTPESKAVINRLGFNGDGLQACLQRIKAWRDTQRLPDDKKGTAARGVLGINVGANKNSADPIADYVTGFTQTAPYADTITVNISSPNTPGLRGLQERQPLAELLQRVMAAREASAAKPPLFVKIAPDLDDAQMEAIAEVVLSAGVQGLIVGNTTVSRPGNLPPDFAKEQGGLSGKPLFELSTRVLGQMYKLTQGKIPLIGCGGVSSGVDAYAKIRAGASLVQLYSALVFEGPGLVPRIKRDLAALLKRDGFQSVCEVVGKG
jgi:dihydroorotate dehydrogenase